MTFAHVLVSSDRSSLRHYTPQRHYFAFSLSSSDIGNALTLDHNSSIHATKSKSHNSGNEPMSPDVLDKFLFIRMRIMKIDINDDFSGLNLRIGILFYLETLIFDNGDD